MIRKVAIVADGENKVGAEGVDYEEDEFRMSRMEGARRVKVSGFGDGVAIVDS